ncbi:MAG: hypothetical protein EXS25_11655 [Pedosphaera sp.]|nr:hypothetical protein [Pedosphaera sp.]
MDQTPKKDLLSSLLANDSRYTRDSYEFLREALEFTQRQIKRSPNAARHVSGQELLDGIREFALKQYGPMTQLVLQEWGIYRCEDFGEIVFNMIDYQILKKTSNDSREDFKGGYEFNEAFKKPFQPLSTSPSH